MASLALFLLLTFCATSRHLDEIDAHCTVRKCSSGTVVAASDIVFLSCFEMIVHEYHFVFLDGFECTVLDKKRSPAEITPVLSFKKQLAKIVARQPLNCTIQPIFPLSHNFSNTF